MSAEVYGHYNKRENFVPRVIPKDEDTRHLIDNLLSKSFLFRHLQPDEKSIIVDAMDIKYF